MRRAPLKRFRTGSFEALEWLEWLGGLKQLASGWYGHCSEVLFGHVSWDARQSLGANQWVAAEMPMFVVPSGQLANQDLGRHGFTAAL